MSEGTQPNPIVDSDDFSKLLKVPTPIIKGILYQPVFTTIWGPPESGKSHIAVDLACTISLSYPVMYVSAEAPYEISTRMKAWANYHSKSFPKGNLKLWTEPLLLTKGKYVKSFISTVGIVKPMMIFIDPLAQCFADGDENSTKDMSLVTYNINRISRELNCGICVVAHTGWNTSHERGSSVLRGTNRISLSVSRSSEGVVRLHSEKMNAGKPITDRYFTIIQTGDDEMATVLLPSKQESSTDLSLRQKQVLLSLYMPVFKDGVQRSELAKYTESAYGITTSGTYKSANRLIEMDLVTSYTSGKIAITDEGVEVAKKLETQENLEENLGQNEFNWTISNYPVFSTHSPSNSPLDSPIIQHISPYKGDMENENGENVEEYPLESNKIDKKVN